MILEFERIESIDFDLEWVRGRGRGRERGHGGVRVEMVVRGDDGDDGDGDAGRGDAADDDDARTGECERFGRV